jgi:hypothetical protein
MFKHSLSTTVRLVEVAGEYQEAERMSFGVYVLQ